VRAVEQPPADEPHRDAGDHERRGADARAPQLRADERPQGDHDQHGHIEQRTRVQQIGGTGEQAGLERAAFDQAGCGQDDERCGEQFWPGEPDLVHQERRRRRQQQAEARGTDASEGADQGPQREQRGGGEDHRRDPEGHEALRVER
jgi:hypothetical protein